MKPINDIITTGGIIVFDPPHKTEKHRTQGVWKKTAYVSIGDDSCKYYCWFMKKRFNLPLKLPLRGAHITFINDAVSDFGTEEDWLRLKKKWEGKYVEVDLHLEPRSDDENWWLAVTEETRKVLHDIRAELGLGKPYWGLHMTIGSAQDVYDDTFEFGMERIKRQVVDHSKYINRLFKKKLIN